ncbi:MAG: ABC transporter permease [Granulosicoccaceae bacterium]
MSQSIDPNQHWVSDKVYNPGAVDAPDERAKDYHQASQWKRMWWQFKQHKLALYSAMFIIALYASIPLVEFLAPYSLPTRHTDHIYSPPQPVHFFDQEGNFKGPFVYGWDYELDMVRLHRNYSEDTARTYAIEFFHRGDPYKFLGLIPTNIHLIGVEDGGKLFLLGTDRLGRDQLSRMLYGMRISMTIGLVGVLLSFALGITLGCLAGYFGGWIDNLIQRITEVIRSIPELPLWMALSAILPITWSPLWIFFGVSTILAFLDWTGLARAVRSKLISLREEDFATAAVYMGAKPKRVIGKHLLPGFFSHLVASASLSVPAMILGETALSFLGLGLRPPVTSWGVLLNEAQNFNIVAIYPWLMVPAIPVICVVLAFNFLGDGLRDAADPYSDSHSN